MDGRLGNIYGWHMIDHICLMSIKWLTLTISFFCTFVNGPEIYESSFVYLVLFPEIGWHGAQLDVTYLLCSCLVSQEKKDHLARKRTSKTYFKSCKLDMGQPYTIYMYYVKRKILSSKNFMLYSKNQISWVRMSLTQNRVCMKYALPDVYFFNTITFHPIKWYISCYKEAPIYFSNIFISFLGLAYFTPLGCPVKFKNFLAV